MEDTFGGFQNGIVHDHVAAGFQDLDVGDTAVFLDLNLQSCDERLGVVEDGLWLLPLAVKAIVDQVVIPAEL